MFLSHDDIEYLPPAPAPAAKPSFAGEATTLTPGVFTTPDDLLIAAQQLDAFISGMSTAVASVPNWKGRGVPAGTGVAFDAFRKSWSDFFTSDFSSRIRVLAHQATTNLSGTLRNFQEQAAEWAKKLKKWGVKVPGIAPQGVESGGKNIMMWIGIGAVTLVGLFLIGKVIHKATLGNAELVEAEDEAMRIADEKARKKRLRSL